MIPEHIPRPVERVENLLETLEVFLAENDSPGLRLSVYLPAGPGTADAERSRARGREALRQAERLADTSNLTVEEVQTILAPLIAIVEDEDFWQQQRGGFFLGSTPSGARCLEVNERFEPTPLLSPRLTPLLALAANVDAYHLLSLRFDDVRLFQGSRLGLRDITTPELARGFASDDARWLRSGGDRPEMIDAKTNREVLLGFFADVDRELLNLIGDSDYPLLLAGSVDDLPLYAEVTKHPRFIRDRIVPGDHKNSDLIHLHGEARRTLHHEFLARRKQRLLRFDRMEEESDRVSSDLATVLPEAYRGNIRTALLPSDRRTWGRFDAGTGQILPLEETDPAGVDLFQLVAENVLRTDGEVFYLEHNRMPHGVELGAEFHESPVGRSK